MKTYTLLTSVIFIAMVSAPPQSPAQVGSFLDVLIYAAEKVDVVESKLAASRALQTLRAAEAAKKMMGDIRVIEEWEKQHMIRQAQSFGGLRFAPMLGQIQATWQQGRGWDAWSTERLTETFSGADVTGNPAAYHEAVTAASDAALDAAFASLRDQQEVLAHHSTAIGELAAVVASAPTAQKIAEAQANIQVIALQEAVAQREVEMTQMYIQSLHQKIARDRAQKRQAAGSEIMQRELDRLARPLPEPYCGRFMRAPKVGDKFGDCH